VTLGLALLVLSYSLRVVLQFAAITQSWYFEATVIGAVASTNAISDRHNVIERAADFESF
jgi:hypothetical protein